MTMMASDREIVISFTLHISFLDIIFIYVKVQLLASLVIWLCFTNWQIELIRITDSIVNIRPIIGNILISFNKEVMQNSTCVNSFQNVRQSFFLYRLFHNHWYTMQPGESAFPNTNCIFRSNAWLG